MNKNTPVWFKNPDGRSSKEASESLWIPTVVEDKVRYNIISSSILNQHLTVGEIIFDL